MSGACAIVFDADKSYAVFARIKGGRIFFVKEQAIDFACGNDNIADCCKKSVQLLEKTIQEVEKLHALRIDDIFVQLPSSQCNFKNVSDIFPLGRRKKINTADVILAKKYLEDKFIDWDDHCVHNIITSYEAASRVFNQAPCGVWSHRLGVNSFLVWIKDKLYRDAEEAIDSLNRRFAGFIAAPIGVFSSCFFQRAASQSVISIECEISRCVLLSKKGIIERQYTAMGYKNILEAFAKNFFFDHSLAIELFERYITFKETPHHYEVTVKKDGAYINVSAQSLNSFVKQYIKEQFSPIACDIKSYFDGEPPQLSVIGALAAKEGALSFFKECLSQPLYIPSQYPLVSSAYGCLTYGVKRFMERDRETGKSFFKRVVETYREYF